MKLFWSSRSPYVRKVMIVAHEKGLAGALQTERVVVSPAKPNPAVMAHNPLNKIPTLILDDGSALYDSRVIAEYFDQMGTGPRLFPEAGPARIAALRRQALGDGMLDFLLPWLLERLRPAEKQSPELIDGCRLKLNTVLNHLEKNEVVHLAGQPVDIGQIAIGTALGYADFRYGDENWRNGRSGLAEWYAGFAARPSMKATEHVNEY
jgi:glutathione S-transferase